MKKLIAIAFLLLCGLCAGLPCEAQYVPTTLSAQQHGGGATPSVYQYCINSNFGTSVTCANFSVGSLQNGDLLVAWGFASTGVTLTTTVSGCSLTWTTINTGSPSSGTAFFATAPITSTASCTGASRPAISGSGSSENITIEVVELQNVVNTVDGTPGYASNSSSGNFSGPSTTTTVNGDMVLAFSFAPSTTAYTVNSPFTTFYAASLLGSYYQTMANEVQSSSGAINAAYTYSGSLQGFTTAIIALKP